MSKEIDYAVLVEQLTIRNSCLRFQVEHLQEQLADASKTIDYYDKKDFHYTLADGTVMGAEPAHKYKIKWGVK